MTQKSIEDKICLWKRVAEKDPKSYSNPKNSGLNCLKCDGYDNKCHVYKSIKKSYSELLKQSK